MRNPNSLSSTAMRLLMVSGLILSTIFIAAQGWAKTGDAPNKPNDVRINLLLSGGGTRAAAFAYGAMYELNHLWYCPKDKEEKTIRLESQPGSSTLPTCQPVLHKINRISAVSGGSITAGYYKIHHQDGEFIRTFPTVLKEGKITRELLTSDRPGSLWRFLRPPTLVATSVVDTIFSVLSVPLFFLPIHFEFTPPAAMALTDGIIESGQLASAYDDLYFDGQTLDRTPTLFPFGSIVPFDNSKPPKDHKKLDVLIHATDIANGKVFTFDEDTFECLGIKEAYNNFPLALAAAASSSLPGIFAPVQLDEILESASPLAANHDKCALIASDKMRPPLLVDGGVSDNLGVGGILSKVFEAKRLQSDRRDKKDFLIIVDSGTETESNLPGLAGHIDNSFDALIKDKTTISKLIANGLLSQFGFHTLELKLSDVVTDPLIRQLATEFIGHQNHFHSSQSHNHRKLIEKGYRATELERKVLDDLNRSGLTPSAEQIDTLIAAGRAVVRARYQQLEDEWNKAIRKQFSPVCGNVSNFSKFYCWPVEFEQPHLASNRIGPLLQALTETGNAIRDRATQKRIDLAPSLRDVFRGYINVKTESSKSSTLGKRVNDLFEILGKRVVNDDKFDQLMNESKNGTRAIGPLQHDDSIKPPETSVPPLPTQQKHKNAIKDPSWERWNGARASLDRILLEAPFQENLNEQTLSADQKQCIKTVIATLNQIEPELRDIPQYYLLQASLANLLDKTDLVRSLLHTGMDKFPDNPSMQARAGLMLLIDLVDYRNGLDRLERGYTLLKQRIFALRTIDSRVNDQSVVADLLQHYIYREQVLKQWLAFALATAPFPVPGDTRYVSDRHVHEWELLHLPSKHGESLLDWLKGYRTSLEEKLQTPPCVPKTSSDMLTHYQESCAWLNQLIREHNAPLRDSLKTLMMDLWRCSASLKDCTGSYSTSNLRKKLSQQVDTLRVEIKEELAKTIGVERAEEYARESYEWFLKEEEEEKKKKKKEEEEKTQKEEEKEKKEGENDKDLSPQKWRERANSAVMYGLVLLRKNASLPCPARDGAIKKSEELFQNAKKREEDSQENQKPKKSEESFLEGLLRIAQDTKQPPTLEEHGTFTYNDFVLIAEDLSCLSNTH